MQDWLSRCEASICPAQRRARVVPITLHAPLSDRFIEHSIFDVDAKPVFKVNRVQAMGWEGRGHCSSASNGGLAADDYLVIWSM